VRESDSNFSDDCQYPPPEKLRFGPQSTPAAAILKPGPLRLQIIRARHPSAFHLKDDLTLVFPESSVQTVLTDQKGEGMNIKTFRNLWTNDEAQDIAEYAVMLAVILVLVVGTIRLIGGSSNNVFSSVASSIGQ
jgi:Flp pilus assembly pilin Flp